MSIGGQLKQLIKNSLERQKEETIPKPGRGDHPVGGGVSRPRICIDMSMRCDSFFILEGGSAVFFLALRTVDCPCYCCVVVGVYKGFQLSNTVGFNCLAERVGALGS